MLAYTPSSTPQKKKIAKAKLHCKLLRAITSNRLDEREGMRMMNNSGTAIACHNNMIKSTQSTHELANLKDKEYKVFYRAR